MFKWKDSYSVNVAEIDKQHQQLFKLGQAVYDIVSLNDGYDHYDEIVATLTELKNYTIYHFAYEEKVLQSHNFKELETHKKEHATFVEKISNIAKEDFDEKQRKVLMELLVFILNWVETHILKTDMNYKEVLNNQGLF